MSTALVPNETPAPSEFVLTEYLATLDVEMQQKLAAAYDGACKSLIGPNDVQRDGARTFKKKSAWRKLARHFRISVGAELNSVRVDRDEFGFTVAYAVATASAPWGQSWTDVGACGTDEATGNRKLTIADAIATAMTRASNRAVSNLIAMGEVSAEEIGERQPARGAARPLRDDKPDADKAWPWGERKGTRLGDFPTDELESMLKWCRDKQKTDVAKAIASVLADRVLGRDTSAVKEPDENDYPVALLDDQDDLPF